MISQRASRRTPLEEGVEGGGGCDGEAGGDGEEKGGGEELGVADGAGERKEGGGC